MLRDNQLLRRISMAAGFALLLLLIFAFSGRVADFTRLSAQRESEGARLTELVSTQSYLKEQLAYATSVAAVEEWARQQGGMAQPGDFVVVPLVPPGTTPQASASDPAVQERLSNFQTWLQWFFYRSP